MKRHPAFQDLSRDHHVALLAALDVRRAAEGHPRTRPLKAAVEALAGLWTASLSLHFDEEDIDLMPVLVDQGAHALSERLRTEHADLRTRFSELEPESAPALWDDAARLLHQHIRWEEDELFPWLQDNLLDAELERLLAASVAFRLQTRGPDAVRPPRP